MLRGYRSILNLRHHHQSVRWFTRVDAKAHAIPGWSGAMDDVFEGYTLEDPLVDFDMPPDFTDMQPQAGAWLSRLPRSVNAVHRADQADLSSL